MVTAVLINSSGMKPIQTLTDKGVLRFLFQDEYSILPLNDSVGLLMKKKPHIGTPTYCRVTVGDEDKRIYGPVLAVKYSKGVMVSLTEEDIQEVTRRVNLAPSIAQKVANEST